MMASWPCPTPGGGTADEHAFALDHARPARLLIVPPPLDEGNRLRRMLIQAMRALDAAGVDAILIDLPGCNESVQPLAEQTLAGWRQSVAAAAAHFGATHILAVRAGGLGIAEETAARLPVLAYAPQGGAALLRQMVRMRVLSAREAGREERPADLIERGRTEGLVLAGYRLGAAMIVGLEQAGVSDAATALSQGDIGGPGLWLRAEPGEDPAQATALASAVARWMGAAR